jgi:TRAP-type transport system small permease protein
VDTLVKRLPPIGKKICLAASQLLMLYATWLFLNGSWEQSLRCKEERWRFRK